MEVLKPKKEKTFAYHWGSGHIAEEAQVETPWDIPTLQLMKYTEGDAAGQLTIRFCHYSYEGRFRRSPLMLSSEAIEDMRYALKTTPELLALLRHLVSDPDEPPGRSKQKKEVSSSRRDGSRTDS